MNDQLIIQRDCWDYFWTCVDLCPGEVGAFGYCTRVDGDDPHFYVDDIFLVPQDVSAASVEFVESGLHYALERATADDRAEDLRFCIHSHGTIAAHWSATDDAMIADLKKTGTPWFVSAIFNKARETAARLDVFETGIPDLVPIEMELDMMPDVDEQIVDQAIADIEEHVTQKPKFPKTNTHRNTPPNTPYKYTPTSFWDHYDPYLTNSGTRYGLDADAEDDYYPLSDELLDAASTEITKTKETKND